MGHARWFGWLVAICLAQVVACTPAAAVRNSAAPLLGCPEQAVKVTDPDHDQAFALKRKLAGTPRMYRADGCGRVASLVESCPDGAREGTKACKWVSVNELRESALRRRASFDLSCEPGLLKLTALDAQTVGVNACGQQVTYVWTCPHDPILYSSKCSWILNNETRLRTAPPASQPPGAPSAPPATAPPQPEAPPSPPVTSQL